MPNWCDCELLVRGKKEDVEKFAEFAKGKSHHLEAQELVLCTDNFIPYPEQFRKLDVEAQELRKKLDAMSEPERKAYIEKHGWPKDGFNQGGYEWCITNWGTKWGLCNPRIIDKAETKKVEKRGAKRGQEAKEPEYKILYGFETAWAPPHPVILKMSQMFPTLKFQLKYFEGGMEFQGTIQYKEGNVAQQSTSDYHGHRGG